MSQTPCPSCGHCPTCGHTPQQFGYAPLSPHTVPYTAPAWPTRPFVAPRVWLGGHPDASPTIRPFRWPYETVTDETGSWTLTTSACNADSDLMSEPTTSTDLLRWGRSMMGGDTSGMVDS